MSKTKFPDTKNLNELQTAAAINSTLHHLRLKRFTSAQTTLVELLCNFLEQERDQIVQSALSGLYFRHGIFNLQPEAENATTEIDFRQETGTTAS